MNKITLSRIQKMVGVVLAISYSLAVFTAFRTRIVPEKYLLIGVAITSLAIIPIIYIHFKRTFTKAKSIAFNIFSVLIAILCLYISSANGAVTAFLDNVQENGYYTEEYSIIAKKDRNIDLASSNKLTALLATDTNSELVKTEVDKKTKTDYKDYPELTSLTHGLNNKEVDTSALKSSYVRLLEDNNNSFYQTIEVLATFTIKIKSNTQNTTSDTTKPFVVYISSIDTYGAISTVSRSDVNILAVINPQSHEILLVNTPRDYYVQLHGTTGTKDKLTHAGIYGIDMSVSTLQDLYDTHIDYYLRVNFASLTSIVDTLGGVDVYSDNSFKVGSRTYNTGINHLNGKDALAFSRERYSFSDGDRTRGKNQQRVIEAIIQKLNDPSTLMNYQNILKSFSQALQTNASQRQITALARQQMDDMRDWQVKSISVDGTGTTAPTYSMGNLPLSVIVPDQASLASAKQMIRLHESE